MRADRLLAIMLLLQNHGRLTTARLAETLEVSRRTVLRDLNALCTAGVPVYTDSGPGGGVYLSEKYRVSLTGLKDNELRSLFIASLTGPLSDIGLRQAAETGFLKLLANLPSPQRTEIERVRQRLHIDLSAWSSYSQPFVSLSELLDAVFADSKIVLTYNRRNGESVIRTVDPYSLVCKATVWYLLAAYEGTVHSYRVSRIRAIEFLTETFERPESFDLKAFWEIQLKKYNAYAPPFWCVLEVKSQRLHFLNWPFVYEYTIKEKAGTEGWQIVALAFSSFDAAEMLILALAEDARIIEPASLLLAVRQKASSLNTTYNSR